MAPDQRAVRILIAAGGTGGHIYPGLAVARGFAERHPGAQIHFVGTARGLEQEIIGAAGFPVHMLRAEPLRGGSALRRLRAVWALLPAFTDAGHLLRRLQPDVVVGVGGYISGALLLRAALRRIPTLVIEPNYEPGLANRLLARFVDRAAVAWDETADDFHGKAFVSGNPVRPEIAAVPDIALDVEPSRASAAPAAAAGATTRAPLRVLLFGGSQGSRVLNDAMVSALAHMPAGACELTHQTGPADLERVRTAYRDAKQTARVEAYITDMDAEYARCHVVVARAGATTCAELAAAGRGAILVPLEVAAGHQRSNAEALQRVGAAQVIYEADLNGAALAGALDALARQPERCVEMGARARRHARPDATARIVDELEALLAAATSGQR